MRDQLTERPRECFVFGVVEVILVAEEYDLITKQGIADGVQDFRRQPQRQSHARDFSADTTRDRMHAKLGSSQQDFAHRLTSNSTEWCARRLSGRLAADAGAGSLAVDAGSMRMGCRDRG
jgi:hypothetical protein